MPLLYHWQQDQFLRDNSGPMVGDDLALSQNSPVLQGAMDERMWVFTHDCEGRYVLAASVHIESVQESGSAFGSYTVVPRPGSTVRYRMVNPSVDVEPTIRSLSIAPKAKILGHSFQGPNAVRRLSPEDDLKLLEFAARLKHATPGLPWRLSRCK